MDNRFIKPEEEEMGDKTGDTITIPYTGINFYVVWFTIIKTTGYYDISWVIVFLPYIIMGVLILAGLLALLAGYGD